jgi:hypothetical protein
VFGITRDTLEKKKDIDFSSKIILNDNQLSLIQELICLPKDDFAFAFKRGVKSLREFLQILGTDILRRHNPEWHIHIISKTINSDSRFVFADTRFPNELDFIKRAGGECWFIMRDQGYTSISNHISEVSLVPAHFEHVLVNEGVSMYTFQRKWKDYLLDDVYPGTCLDTVTCAEPSKTPMLMYVLGALASGNVVSFEQGRCCVNFKTPLANEQFDIIFGQWGMSFVLEYLKSVNIIPGVDSGDCVPLIYASFWKQGYNDHTSHDHKEDHKIAK